MPALSLHGKALKGDISVNIQFPMEQTVKNRSSVRNYSDQEVEAEKLNALTLFVESLDNPFGQEVAFHFLNQDDVQDPQKLGTYGVIKGAKRYIGASIKEEPMALEALGYEFETAILYLAHLGLGSCWLGGTFNRKGFATAMDIRDGKLFPAATPYGYGASKMHLKETMMRKVIRADHRKPWEKLFFSQDFQTPLSKEAACDLAFPLEMVRQGPSASNKQPWRVLFKDGACHFYESKEPGYSDSLPYDIQRLDMGIAAAHFDLSIKEKEIKGHFDTDCEPALTLPPNMHYVFSWIRE